MIRSLIISLSIATSLFAEGNDEEVCESSRCRYAVQHYLDSINNNIDPCDDFYSHVCSGWIKNNSIPPNHNEWSSQKLLSEILKSHLQDAVLEFPHPTFRPLSVVEIKLQQFYYTCLNAGLRIDSTVKGSQKLFERIGGFPLLGMPLVKGYQWQDSLATVKRELNLEGIILSLDVLTDVDSSDTVYLLQPSEDFVKEKNATVEEVLTYLALFNRSHENESAIRESIEKMIDFETSLRMIMENGTGGEHVDEFYKATTAGELHQFMGEKVNIMRYLKNSINGIADIRNDTEVIVPYFKMKNIRKVLEQADEKTIANYIVVVVLKQLLHGAGKSDQDEIESKRYCINTIIQLLPLAVAHAYSNIYDLETPQNDELKGMLLELKEEYKGIINRTEWMDNVTKSTALKKVQKISGEFLGPEIIRNETLLLEYYSMYNLNIDFFESITSLKKLRDEEELNFFRYRQSNIFLWPKIIVEVTAGYDGITNTVFVPVALATFPFYLHGLPPVVHFGSIGTIMGHEITHAFQGSSRTVDENGKFRNWWTNSSTEIYKKKLRCTLKKYSKYSDPITGVKLKASRTSHEDFADNAGLKVAYLAYKRYMQNCTGHCSLRLPGLNYTADQLFFVAYAFIGCSKYSVNAAVKLYRKEDHSPFRIRISASLKNSEEFSKAFGCNSNSRMNSEKKCPIW